VYLAKLIDGFVEKILEMIWTIFWGEEKVKDRDTSGNKPRFKLRASEVRTVILLNRPRLSSPYQ
jgi:hypothetical protein